MTSQILRLKEFYSKILGLADMWADILTTYLIYLQGMEEAYKYNLGVKIAFFVNAISIMAPFLISYSCFILIKFSRGDYE